MVEKRDVSFANNFTKDFKLPGRSFYEDHQEDYLGGSLIFILNHFNNSIDHANMYYFLSSDSKTMTLHKVS